MIIGRVVGSIVSTVKDDKLTGKKLLVIQPCDLITTDNDGKPLVAVDTVGSGQGEIVMVVSGSSARQTDSTTGKPVDAAVIGIIDQIEIGGRVTFAKSEEK